jgi:hypothetical protein
MMDGFGCSWVKRGSLRDMDKEWPLLFRMQCIDRADAKNKTLWSNLPLVSRPFILKSLKSNSASNLLEGTEIITVTSPSKARQ